jgi:hypothetical protein
MTDIRLLYLMMRIKKYRLLPFLAFSAFLCGCASFNSGDILVERSAARAMLDDRTVVPFSDIKVSWRNYPYRSPTDSIGEGSISNPLKPQTVPAPGEDSAALGARAKEIYKAAARCGSSSPPWAGGPTPTCSTPISRKPGSSSYSRPACA